MDRFFTTPWSVVLAAANRTSPECDRALERLCGVYWYPLYAFIRRQGHPHHEAEDFTQEFFSRLLEKDYLDGVGPEKGKFRSFLLVCIKRFLANEHDRATAKKRGGGRRHLSIDFGEADERYRLEPSHDVTAERIYQRRWALALLEQVLAILAQEFQRTGKGELFETLKAYLVGEHDAPPYAEVGERLGLSEGAVKVAVYRLRQRFRRVLRAEVARTVADDSDIDQEIRLLFEALGN